MIADGASAYCCVPTIVWVKDAEQTILIEEKTKHSWIVSGENAAIWDWLTLNYPSERIVRLLSVLSGTSTEEARKALAAILQEWEKAGIVRVIEGNRRGEPGDQRCLQSGL
jgi:hypothetical protein